MTLLWLEIVLTGCTIILASMLFIVAGRIEHIARVLDVGLSNILQKLYKK